MSDDRESNPNIAGALTYPGRSEEMRPAPVQPRQPRTLQGLLRFAMDATKAEDAPGNSELGPMDEERRKFLEEALKSLTVDIAQTLQRAIRVLTDSEKIQGIKMNDPLPEDVQTSFNNLMIFIDDIDIANDFSKLGGFAMFPVCYGSENEEVRERASGVLAELCQNNHMCQTRALECGLLNVLLHFAGFERGRALVKCVYAISCVSREYPPACRELIAQGACETLVTLLRAPETAVRTKAAFLIRHLCSQYPQAREQFIAHNIVDTMAAQIKCGRDESSEHILSVLQCLLDLDVQVVEYCRNYSALQIASEHILSVLQCLLDLDVQVVEYCRNFSALQIASEHILSVLQCLLDLDVQVVEYCRNPALNLQQIIEDHLEHPIFQTESFLEEREYCQDILRKVFDNYSPVEILPPTDGEDR